MGFRAYINFILYFHLSENIIKIFQAIFMLVAFTYSIILVMYLNVHFVCIFYWFMWCDQLYDLSQSKKITFIIIIFFFIISFHFSEVAKAKPNPTPIHICKCCIQKWNRYTFWTIYIIQENIKRKNIADALEMKWMKNVALQIKFEMDWKKYETFYSLSENATTTNRLNYLWC